MQYVQASPQQVASQQRLGQNLAGALGGYLNQYAANQALGGLENDPEYQKMPASARLSKLEQALRPLGDLGKQIYQQRAPIEQMRGQEMAQQQERQAASQLWQKLYPGTDLPPG